ncbi:hypothetical protein GCM10018980_70460 [Streptomyces capoamus]|uniref:Uncharacterized protein n=1 Tax=Streptomyces capoamus TaxID=68183 RepID=A0A919F2Q7_9ACTN|nr:hypothetical protein GCM10010501_17670 [Streptomyces libani subsp. rufus]GHG73906.1 hypothetical protein GCM10018980_70460 [Streptomyces capoamus]
MAKPAMGQSAFTLGRALADAGSGRPTLVQSLELSKAEVNNRIAAVRSRRGTAPPHGRWSGHRGRRLTAHATSEPDLRRSGTPIRKTRPVTDAQGPQIGLRRNFGGPAQG